MMCSWVFLNRQVHNKIEVNHYSSVCNNPKIIFKIKFLVQSHIIKSGIVNYLIINETIRVEFAVTHWALALVCKMCNGYLKIPNRNFIIQIIYKKKYLNTIQFAFCTYNTKITSNISICYLFSWTRYRTFIHKLYCIRIKYLKYTNIVGV